MSDAKTSELKTTPLYDFHLSFGAKMVPFAGYSMPVQYAAGVMREHLHTRTKAGLFDVSHMGQVILRGENAALELERLAPMDLVGLGEGRQRYGLFTNASGGILDDFMVANRSDHLFIIVNAACKEADIALMQENLNCMVEPVTGRALLALQGPTAERALSALVPEAAAMRFMDVGVFASDFGELWISRSGYTGEDGYEVSVVDAKAVALAQALNDMDDVLPIGLGARDSLRLEAGLCLYGSDIDETTTPIEAALPWAIQKARRAGGARAGGFPGAPRILKELDQGPERVRVGLLPQARAPMRTGTQLFETETSQSPIGHITSGAFGPTVESAISMGYVARQSASVGTVLYGEVRGKRMPAEVSALPFTKANFKR